MHYTMYFYGTDEELNLFIKRVSCLFDVQVSRTTNSWKLQLETLSCNESLDRLSEDEQQSLYSFFSSKFESKKGRHKIVLLSKEELELERGLYSVVDLARKYNCSPSTINRRLGLIRKK